MMPRTASIARRRCRRRWSVGWSGGRFSTCLCLGLRSPNQARTYACAACARPTQAAFPAGVVSPAQYGDRIKGVAVYLNVAQLIPEDRVAELLRDLFGADTICPASIAAWGTKKAADFAGLAAHVADLVAHSPVRHLDETGLRVAGRTQWLQAGMELAPHLDGPAATDGRRAATVRAAGELHKKKQKNFPTGGRCAFPVLETAGMKQPASSFLPRYHRHCEPLRSNPSRLCNRISRLFMIFSCYIIIEPQFPHSNQTYKNRPPGPNTTVKARHRGGGGA